MAELIKDEQKEKQTSSFLKIEDGAVITLRSNLVKTRTHFLEKEKSSVACIGEGCFFCQRGIPFRNEYFYWGTINGEKGLIRLPATVLFNLNESERVLKEKKQNFEWIISKSGSGLQTRYAITRGKNIEVAAEEIEKNNKNLLKKIEAYEKTMREKYDELSVEGKKEFFDEDIPLPEDYPFPDGE